jgi:hypothetical protein
MTAWSSAAAAQTLGQGPEVGVAWWRVLAALAVCIGLAVVAALALKKRLGGGPMIFAPRSSGLKLIENLRLSHQIDLCVVLHDDQELLIAAGPQGATLLRARDAKPVMEERP